MNSFGRFKSQFNKENAEASSYNAFIPVHLSLNSSHIIRNKKGEPNEEYFKWQFFYSLVSSGLYAKDYLGAEVHFPKGNVSSAPIIFDGAVFDDKDWFSYYEKFHKDKDQSALDWLRKHLVAVIEFKKENGRNIEAVWNQQLKPALKECENSFCLGVLYDTEKLFLFKKQENSYIRFDDGYNLKKEQSSTKELSLHLSDSYYKLPNFNQLVQRVFNPAIDRSRRTVEDLDVITGAYSLQLSEGIAAIIRTMDKVSLKNQRGYEILIQVLALKIYDEKRNQKVKQPLRFYITPEQKNYVKLSEKGVSSFVERMQKLYKEASQEYTFILDYTDSNTINWKKTEHVRVISEIVEQFQDYSFVLSQKTDLYQIVFYKFASEFSKADKGQFVTPIPLIDFLVNIVNPKIGEKVIDPTAGIADFLSVSFVNTKQTMEDKNFYGVDNDEQMIMLAQLNMLLNGNGNSILRYKPDKGSIIWKFDERDGLVALDPLLHKNGDWDNWKDETKLKKFDVVLTNPPFGNGRKYVPANDYDREVAEMYELWNIARSGNGIDLGLIFLENAYRILGENGRMGIVLSNSIASIAEFEKAREWLLSKMRIVACFDMPANVFAETGVNTTVIIAYKPSEKELEKLQRQDYQVYMRSIENVGYKVCTDDRVKRFEPIYMRDPETFDILTDNESTPLLLEDFSETVREFKEWCLMQEETLQKIFL